MEFQTQITLSHNGDNYTFPTFESCNVTSSVTDLVPSFDFTVKMPKDTTLVDRFPPLTTEVTILQGRPGNLKKTICGYLKSPPKSRDGPIVILQYSGVGYYDKTRYIIVNESYSEKTIDFIIRDLRTKYLSTFDTGAIEYCDKIISIKFSMEFLSDAIDKLTQVINFICNIDNDKKFNFHSEAYIVDPNPITEVPFTYERGSAKFEDSADRLVNQLYIIGGMQLSSGSVTQAWTANGVDKTFAFASKPVAALTSGEYNFTYNSSTMGSGNSSTIGSGIKGKDNFSTTIKVLVDENNGTFDTFETYLNGTIQAEYRYKYPMLDIINNSESQKEYGLISGKITINSDDRDYVLEQANNQLTKYAFPVTKGSLRPLEPLYAAGELVYIDIPTLKIQKHLKITSASYDSTPGHLSCSIDLEGDASIAQTIKSLQQRIAALEKDYQDDNAVVNKIYQGYDNIPVPVVIETASSCTHILNTPSDSLYYGGDLYI